MTTEYQICTKTVMDTSDPNIVFDEKGICNHYYEYIKAEQSLVLKGEAGKKKTNHAVELIKEHGKGKEYDSILGLSGGVDSSYVAYLAKQYGLRPLVVHFDNGWNSELAVKNIENIVNKLGFDLHTIVINWEEFKDLQLSYLKASVVDIEAITDHAILASVNKTAAKHKIKYILSGTNVVTEQILPADWIYNKGDSENIKDIHRQYGFIPLKTFPLMTSFELNFYLLIKNIKTISFLDWLPYNKKDVKEFLKSEFGWRDYGGKHYESIFTKFYQGYILPTKFGIDKRRAHLSTLICSGQISREEALNELEKVIYDPLELKEDMEFVLKKLGLSSEEFESLMMQPRKEHSAFVVQKKLIEQYQILKLFRPLYRLINRFR